MSTVKGAFAARAMALRTCSMAELVPTRSNAASVVAGTSRRSASTYTNGAHTAAAAPQNASARSAFSGPSMLQRIATAPSVRPRYWIGTAASTPVGERSGRMGWPTSIARRAAVELAVPEDASVPGEVSLRPTMTTPSACVWRRIACAACASTVVSSPS